VLRLVRPLFILVAALLILVACTRERPTPEPTATTAVQVSAPATPPQAVEAESNTPEAEEGAEAGLAVTNTPSLTVTPSPTSQETFQYVVEAGDTLGSIAEQFGTDVETLRQLNNLRDDSLAVGQPIYVPYVEGMTAEGMPTPTPGPFLYTIQVGDTLSGIGLRFGVDPIAIIEANADGLLDPNNLTIGSTILIPGYQPPPETLPEAESEEESDTPPVAEEPGGEEGSEEPFVHIVQAGQGLIEIATLYGVSIADIAAANGITEQDILRIGQELIIPGVTSRDFAIARGSIHIVQPGESLLSIALLYGVTVEEIQAANELDNPDSIFIGQELIIPAQ
jgi:LysM repeat protein